MKGEAVGPLSEIVLKNRAHIQCNALRKGFRCAKDFNYL